MIRLRGKENEMNTNGKKKKAQLLGRYIVADPKICHGQLTFIGTRILVSESYRKGMARSRDKRSDNRSGADCEHSSV